VLQAIATRARRLRAGLGRDDGMKLGLVVEGGAMRGVVSGGALLALEELGLTDAFDVGYGASAGAINLAYFVLGRARSASRIYFDHAASPKFVNPLRVGKILDLDFLFDEVITQRFPIRQADLRAASTRLFVSVTEARTGRNELLSLDDEGIDPIAALKASAAAPFYYGRSVRVGGGDYVDGMASNALPVVEAMRDGCTHVLLLLSARPGEGSGRAVPPGQHDIAWPERLLLLRHATGFRRAYLVRRRRLRRALSAAHLDGRVHAIHPTAACLVPSRTCRDTSVLEAAAEASRLRTLDALAPYLA
jgi:predicted acylesterase/phospholipase RssA